LRREEVAVLAGVSPTWYTYLEQGRGIQPSREVLDSLARVLRLSEDERRYVHSLAHGAVIHTSPLDAEVSPQELIGQMIALFETSPYPVYAADHHCDLLGWNPAAHEWYDDWYALPPEERNILRWMLCSPVARTRLLDWEDATKDAVARWRAESGKHSADPVLEARVAELTRLSPDFRAWWSQHNVMEHRSRIRRFRHVRLGVQVMRIIPVLSPEIVPAGVVLHVPVQTD
jgi:transcriptional regulator with XRE-family HTH domain